MKSIDFILAVTPIHTRVAGTFIDVFLTALPCIARRTDTAKAINQVPAGSPMLALVNAIVDIDVAVLTRPARDAIAIVASNEVSARICVHTGLDFTLICIYLASLASPLRWANTFESIYQILTGTTVPTWVWRAVINVDGAGWSCPAWGTTAFKASRSFHTASTIVARIRQTGMFSYFTVLPRVPFRTGTLVFVRARVAAGSSVQAGLICSTGVQIFVAELTTPIRFTQTLPWFSASAMDTSRVRNALVAVLSLPSILASAFSGSLTSAMLWATALTTYCFVTFRSHPAFHAGFVAVLIAGIMSKEVISWSTKFVAAKTIIMLITDDSDLIFKMGHASILLQRLPLTIWVDHTRVEGFVYDVIRIIGFIIVVPCLNNECVRSRPGKTERKHNPVLFAVPAVLQTEGIAS